jgi:hypothetical protein
MKTMDIKSILPDTVTARAYEVNSEFAWRPEDLPTIADVLRSRKIPVLGGEVWIRTDSGPMIPSDVYHWSVEKVDTETDAEFSKRSIEEMLRFGTKLPNEPALKEEWGNVYINFQIDTEAGLPG